MKIICLFLSMLLLLAAAQGCAPASSDEPASAAFFAMDTVMEVRLWGDEALLGEAENEIRALESRLSVTDPASEVSRINQTGGGKVSAELSSLIASALALSERTGGAVDLTVYPAVRAWGFTTGEYRVPADEELAALLPLIGWEKVELHDGTLTLPEGAQLDFGSVAKGYAADRVESLLRGAGVEHALLNLGGNVQVIGTKPDGSLWQVAVADPLDASAYAGMLAVSDMAVVTSGGYERYFVEDGVTYRHILDPKTARPVDNGMLSVTVVGSEGLLCDALSTALFVMGPEDAARFWQESDDFEAVFLTEDGAVTVTEGLAEVFTPLGSWAGKEIRVLTHD